MNFCYEVFIFLNLHNFLLDHLSVSRNCIIIIIIIIIIIMEGEGRNLYKV